MFGPGVTMVTNIATALTDSIVEEDESITFAIPSSTIYSVGAINQTTITVLDVTSKHVSSVYHLRCPHPDVALMGILGLSLFFLQTSTLDASSWLSLILLNVICASVHLLLCADVDSFS